MAGVIDSSANYVASRCSLQHSHCRAPCSHLSLGALASPRPGPNRRAPQPQAMGVRSPTRLLLLALGALLLVHQWQPAQAQLMVPDDVSGKKHVPMLQSSLSLRRKESLSLHRNQPNCTMLQLLRWPLTSADACRRRYHHPTTGCARLRRP